MQNVFEISVKFFRL